MNSRNLSCWAIVVTAYVVLLIMGNREQVTMQRGMGDAWAKLWSRVPVAPGAGQVTAPPPPKRPPPADPPKPMSRDAAEQLIFASACRARTPDFAARLQRSIRVSPVVVDSLDDLNQGASRMAAVADLPANFRWPQFNGRPLDLVAQLQMSDVAEFDEDNLLPKTGWLYFFYALTEDPPITGTQPSDQGAWQVAYYDGAASTLMRTPPPKPAKEQFVPCRVRFWQEWTLPSLAEEPDLLGEGDCGPRFYYDLCSALTRRPQEAGWHHLLGYAQYEMAPMRLICQKCSNGKASENASSGGKSKIKTQLATDDWVPLLQVELDALEGLDEPSRQIVYWIRAADLKKRELGRVWLVAE